MSTTFTFNVISVSTLCSYCMNCYCLDHASIEFPCFKGAFSPSQFEFYLIVDSNCCRHVFKLATSKYGFLDFCIRDWAETRHETNTKIKKLFFCSLASPIIRWILHEFWETKNPKLVFYRTYKEWPNQYKVNFLRVS